jgi:hypothetical protein
VTAGSRKPEAGSHKPSGALHLSVDAEAHRYVYRHDAPLISEGRRLRLPKATKDANAPVDSSPRFLGYLLYRFRASQATHPPSAGSRFAM